MTFLKRAQDLVSLAIIGTFLLPVGIIIAIMILVKEGRPIFYVAERMRTPTESFGLVKFRTMTAEDGDEGVSGGHKTDRITPFGKTLRRKRLDEIPQLWNVLTGDMSFVGPRAPLRKYVDEFPDLYAHVLKSRPGITGVASIYFHKHEEQLLAACKTAEEADHVYTTRCVPRKARMDLIYQRNRTVCWDIWLMFRTIM